jgi:hypothetical protein
LSGDPQRQLCGGTSKQALDPFFRGIFEWTPGCFTCRDEIRNHRDEPLRPSFVGSNELGIERDQDVQFFPIRDPARQIAALKTAHIT